MRVTPRQDLLGHPACRKPALQRTWRARHFRDRVAIILPQRPQTGIAHVAIYQMGAVALPLSHLFGPEALEYRLGDAGAHVAIVDETTLPCCSRFATACRRCATSSASTSIRSAAHGIRDRHAVLEHASPRYAGRYRCRRPGDDHLHQRNDRQPGRAR